MHKCPTKMNNSFSYMKNTSKTRDLTLVLEVFYSLGLININYAAAP